jgi:hypothetical protein
MLTHYLNKPDRLNRYILAGSGRKIPRLLGYMGDGGWLATSNETVNSLQVAYCKHKMKASHQLVSYSLLFNSATGLIGKLMANSVVC